MAGSQEQKVITAIEQAARDGARPPDTSLNVVEWGKELVVVDDTSNWKGQKWKPELTPFVHEPMMDYVNDEISELTVMAGSQVAKTQPFLICLCWTIINDPSPTLWVSSTEPVLKIFAKARMWPTLTRCKPVADILGEMPRADQGVFHIYFPNMLLSLTSSEANAELQSTPYRRIILDEARKYKPENFNMVMKRTRTFTWNKMQVILSCPEEEKDHVHQAFLNGDQREWEWECKGCHRRQRLYFRKKNEVGDIIGGLMYDTNKKTRPGADYDMMEVVKTVRYKCIHCECSYKDDPEIRWWILNAAINRKGGWKAQNPLALTSHRSYHWSAILPVWVMWDSIVIEFLNAMKALRFGDIMRLREFTVETLGEPFEIRDRLEVSDAPIAKGTYKLGEKWEKESYRFMTIDVQQRCFFCVIRAWAIDGESRLIYEGGGLLADMAGENEYDQIGEKPILTYQELRDIQLKYNVPENNVAIDITHWRAKILKSICIYFNPTRDESGDPIGTWLGFQGTSQMDFLHVDNGQRVRRIYSGMALLDAWVGTEHEGKIPEDEHPEYYPVETYMFSDFNAKERFDIERRSGRWTTATNISKTYRMQIDGEQKIEQVNKKTFEKEYVYVLVGKHGNHIFDCEKMQIVFASMARIIGVERVERDNELSSRKENHETSATTNYTLKR